MFVNKIDPIAIFANEKQKSGCSFSGYFIMCRYLWSWSRSSVEEYIYIQSDSRCMLYHQFPLSRSTSRI